MMPSHLLLLMLKNFQNPENWQLLIIYQPLPLLKMGTFVNQVQTNKFEVLKDLVNEVTSN